MSRTTHTHTHTHTHYSVDLSSKFNETIVMATTADSTVELSCEMRAFIRPDSSLIWEGPDNQRLTGGTGKYQITFSNGSSNAAVNGTLQLVPSRVSTLTVYDPEKSDQGVYTCSIMNSNKTIDLVMMINDAKTAPATIEKVKSSSKSGLYYMTTAAVLMIITSTGVLLQHFI